MKIEKCKLQNAETTIAHAFVFYVNLRFAFCNDQFAIRDGGTSEWYEPSETGDF